MTGTLITRSAWTAPRCAFTRVVIGTASRYSTLVGADPAGLTFPGAEDCGCEGCEPGPDWFRAGGAGAGVGDWPPPMQPVSNRSAARVISAGHGEALMSALIRCPQALPDAGMLSDIVEFRG